VTAEGAAQADAALCPRVVIVGARMKNPGMPITNPEMADYEFLAELYEDEYFPDHVVDKGKAILVRLCERLQAEPPADLEGLYAITNAAVMEFNALEAEFEAAGSEIETVAREEICGDISNIAAAYGFSEADHEMLTHARDW
jgi:hypothetical protein